MSAGLLTGVAPEPASQPEAGSQEPATPNQGVEPHGAEPAGGQAPVANGQAGQEPGLLAGKYSSVEDMELAYKNAQAELTRSKQELAALRGENSTEGPKGPDDYLADGVFDRAKISEELGLDPSTFSPESAAMQHMAKVAFEADPPLSEGQHQAVLKGLLRMLPDVMNVPITREQIEAAQKAEMQKLGPNYKEVYGDTALFMDEILKDPKTTDGEREAISDFMGRADGVMALKRILERSRAIQANVVSPRGNAAAAIASSYDQLLDAANSDQYRTDPVFRDKIDAELFGNSQ